MRKSLLLVGVLVLLVAAFAVAPRDATEFTHTYEVQGEMVPLDFRVHKFNASGVELALNSPQVPTFFIQFDVSMNGFSPEVTMAGLSKGSRLDGTASPRHMPDFPFLRDKQGNPVMRYTFENQLATDNQFNQALRMTYRGVPVPLVETLIIKEPFVLPPALSQRFDVDGQIEFQPGSLRLDREIDGFWIPIRVVGGKEH